MKQLIVGYVRVPQWGAPHKVELRSPAWLWLIEETLTVLTMARLGAVMVGLCAQGISAK